VQVLITQILNQEPLLGESKRPALRQLLQRLVAKLLEPQHSQFDLFKVSNAVRLRALPATEGSSGSTITTTTAITLHSFTVAQTQYNSLVSTYSSMLRDANVWRNPMQVFRP
jgi:hypothetical protein